jgi:ABC-type multidrug transport system ATPase subunit
VYADEPTSGLDARSAQIVMRVVRAIGDNNRTIVCTIHQPSAEIFLNFDELLLLKLGGEQIFYGALGAESQLLVEYFESVPDAIKLKSGYNPATYMLEVCCFAAQSCSQSHAFGTKFSCIVLDNFHSCMSTCEACISVLA